MGRYTNFKRLMLTIGYPYSKIANNECFLRINDKYEIEFYSQKDPIYNIIIKAVLWYMDDQGFKEIERRTVLGMDKDGVISAKNELMKYVF